MAKVITDLDDYIQKLNTLYNASSTPPTSGDEDYEVWTDLANIAINLWESEEGVLWKELFGKLADAADGTKTTSANTYSYSVPSNFKFPASAYIWLGSGTNKTPVMVVDQTDIQLYENNTSNWCYFLQDTSPTLEFNPNMYMPASYTISYNYYKNATALTTGTDTFEMSDPMFAVWYALSELKKEEGDSTAASIATQKIEGMKTRNIMPTWFQSDNLLNKTDSGGGFGT